MPTILLVRHGETDWNRSGQIMGIRPVPLNQNGLTQSARLALQLSALPAPALYSSPVVRARQTADILASTLHVPVIEEPGLSEIGVGGWEGRYWNEFDGDPARVKILSLVATADEPVCACEFTPVLGLSQATVSHHLKRLTEIGLLDREQRGKWAYFSLNAVTLEQLAGLVRIAEVVG